MNKRWKWLTPLPALFLLEDTVPKYGPFEYEVNENGCWLVTSHKPTQYGYIRFKIDGRRVPISAHRWVYEQEHGEKVSPDLMVCHTCDVRNCICPNHLWKGTAADNVHDMNMKGRRVNNKGEAHNLAKLTEEQVREIRNIVGLSQKRIAAMFGIGQAQVCRIRTYQNWGHIK